MADNSEPSFAALSMQLHELFALLAKIEREVSARVERIGWRSDTYRHFATEEEAAAALKMASLVSLARAQALEFMSEEQRRHSSAAALMEVARMNLSALGLPAIAGFDDDHSVGASRSSVKRSHRAEGRNFID